MSFDQKRPRGRPCKPEFERTTKINVRVPDALLAKITGNRSAFVVRAIKAALDNEPWRTVYEARVARMNELIDAGREAAPGIRDALFREAENLRYIIEEMSIEDAEAAE